MRPRTRTVLAGSATTTVALFGGLLLGFVLVEIVSTLAGDPAFDDLPVWLVLAAIVMHVSPLVIGSAGWGVAMGRLAGVDDDRRFARAGFVGFFPVIVAAFVGLGVLEGPLLAVGGLPIHQVFAVLFVPAAGVIAGTSTWRFGLALGDPSRARRWAVRVGLAGALAFLAVVVAMGAAGWVVGAPGARARATMITVTLVGALAAAVVGGGTLGGAIARR